MYTAISIYVVGSKTYNVHDIHKAAANFIHLKPQCLAIGDLRCMDEALLILLAVIH